MPAWVMYVLKFSVSLSLIWLFYQVLLRKLTFYGWNRYYLLIYSLACFFIPLIDVQPVLEERQISRSVVSYLPAVDHYIPQAVLPVQAHGGTAISWTTACAVILLCGCAFLFLRLCIRFISLQRLTRNAAKIQGGFPAIYETAGTDAPFSFGNRIYINRQLYQPQELEDIILHEYIHVKQKHSIDLVVAELICMFNWYNPFAWLLRRAIRQNLEFVADEQVLRSGLNRKDYQWLLLKVSGAMPYPFVNSFSFSSLKRRITMMNAVRSAKQNLLRFLFLLPLLAVVLLAFRNTRPAQNAPDFVFLGIVIDAVNQQQLPGIQIADRQSGKIVTTDERGYFKIKIARDQWKGSHFEVIGQGYEKQPIDFTNEPGPSEQGIMYVIGLAPAEMTDSGRTTLQASSIQVQPAGSSSVLKIPDSSTDSGQTVVSVSTEGKHRTGIFLVNQSRSIDRSVSDPGYDQVLKLLKEFEKANADIQEIARFTERHPEISLFYGCEDGKGKIVFLTDGRFEKYGYPGSPGVDVLEKKYGLLPDLYKNTSHPAGPAYLDKWKAVSIEADKQFHTTNPNALAIVFPGDSRVIAVPRSGKPRIYDMDNGVPEERPAFEQEYGKLPSVVPPPSMKMNKDFKPRISNDTIIQVDASLQGPANPYLLKKVLNTDPMAFIDGKEIPGVKMDSLNRLIDPDQIASIEILKDSTAQLKYGPGAKNGVILIHTKKTTNADSLNSHSFVPNHYTNEMAVESGIVTWT